MKFWFSEVTPKSTAVPAAAPRTALHTGLLLAATVMGFMPAAGAATAGGAITVAWDAAPRTLDPRYAVDANSQYLENLMHCSLVNFDKDGKTIPGLAAEWKWNSPTQLVVTVRGDAKFSDGKPVTTEDVAATFNYFKTDNVANPSPRKGGFAKMNGVKVTGKNSVTFDLAEGDTTFVQNNLAIGILPAAIAAGDMFTEKNPAPGCGPYQFKEMTPNGLELVANPHYSLGPKPANSGVVIKFVKDETTRYAKLRAGEVDIVQNAIGRDKIEEISKKIPDLKVQMRTGLNTTYIGFNMKDPVAGNAKVRKAIGMAIDREKIIKFVLNGLAVPATTLITPSDPFLAKDLGPVGYDPEAAKKLLDEAGFKDPDGNGKEPRLSMTYKTTTDLTRVSVAKAIAADLRKVGINVTVETLEWGRFKADVEAGKVQMWSLAWVGFKDPDIYRFAFATESFPPNGGNRGWYSNPTLDKLMNDARMETDFGKRTALYTQIQKIVREDNPYVFLWHENVFAVVSKKVQGFEVYADGRYSSLTSAVKN